jgi:peptidoglycan/LPS O-acetylase OafA/YrhL
MINRLAIAAGFLVLYVSMYPVLTGGFVIYHYPYWPPPLAATYVLLGILLQAWFCFGRRRSEGRPPALWPQVVAGVVYAAAVVAFPGGIYQS